VRGIGPATLERMRPHLAIPARGSFRSPEELLDVRGIGPATLERLAPLVSTGGEK